MTASLVPDEIIAWFEYTDRGNATYGGGALSHQRSLTNKDFV